MQSISPPHPLTILKKLDDACKNNNNELLNNTNKHDVWRGIGCRINQHHLAVATEHISEILDSYFHESISSVPGAKAWFLGLISLRGQPLPVIDLKQYLFDEATPHTHANRLLVINFNHTTSGLLVDEIYGLKHFNLEQKAERQDSDFPIELSAFIAQSFKENQTLWGEFSIDRLEQDDDFMNASKF